MKSFLAIFTFCLFGWTQTTLGADKLSLAGTWRYQLDRTDAGVSEQWYRRIFTNTLVLPGSLPGQGVGDDITLGTAWIASRPPYWYDDPKYAPYIEPGKIKMPFFLQPNKYYVAPAWYQREIVIPESWKGSRALLSLERPHWGTTVWVDGINFGSYDSLAAPHPYDLGKLAAGSHLLTIRVDNRFIVDVGVNSSSMTDNTQGDWNGIVGDISLTPMKGVWLDDVQVYPHVSSKSITIRGSLANPDNATGAGELLIRVAGRPPNLAPAIWLTNAISWSGSTGAFNIEAPLGADASLWDEFTPSLFDLTISLSEGMQIDDSRNLSFGLREFAAVGNQFMLNGHKTFLRGTLEACVFPNSGHPPTDVDSWLRIIRIAKSYGLNHIRFHTWCPPEAAFEAADELGFYYQVECAAWSSLGQGSSLDAWLYTEGDRILKSYGNHPSFLMMATGNEPLNSGVESYLNPWLIHFKAKDGRRLFTGASGLPEAVEDQFHVSVPPRITMWRQSMYSLINAAPPQTMFDFEWYIKPRNVPVISHEIGEWCVYPNFDEISKYTNYLKAKDFEIFRDFLDNSQLGSLAHPFLQASGKLQVLLYKEEIESALRTPGMGGFQLLGLTDYPGQGPGIVGVLDAFWDEKGYVTGPEYRRFCNSTVPLMRLGKRVFTDNETLNADAEIAHFGAAPLTNVFPMWSLIADNGQSVASGNLPAQTVPVGNGISLGSVHINLAGIPSPARYKLSLGLGGTQFTNDWDVWIYPSQLTAEPVNKPIITTSLTPAILDQLTNGASVLLSLTPLQAGDSPEGRVKLGFSSIFWNSAVFPEPPTTLGILCDSSNALFKDFPTDSHSNWQWWYLTYNAEAMVLDQLPAGLGTPVRVIDDWFSARRLGMLFEARVGLGKLVVCSIDILGAAQTNVVSRQFRSSLLDYMTTPQFSPTTELTVDALAKSGLDLFLVVPPSFIEAPRDLVRPLNQPASFSASVNGTLPFGYAWFHGRLQIASGASSDRSISMTIPSVKTGDEGIYSLRITNSYGGIESKPFSLFVFTPGPGTYAEAVLTNGPVAYWPFDYEADGFSAALDLAGNYQMSHANVAASAGPVPPQFGGFSIANTAASYNGIDSGSQADKLSMSKWGSYTICGWFNPRTMPQPGRTALFGQNDFAELGFHAPLGANPGVLGIWTAGPKLTDAGYGTSVLLANTDSVIRPGQWYFVAVTADSTTVSLFLNGTLAGSAPGGIADWYLSTSPFRAGFGTIDQTGNYFDGLIDEVAVFDRALSAAAINNIYKSSIKGGEAKLYIVSAGGKITMSWTAGVLQSADQIEGPFFNVPRAASPYTNSISDSAKFFRLQIQ